MHVSRRKFMTKRMLVALAASLLVAVGTRAQDTAPTGGGVPGVAQPQGGAGAGGSAPTTGQSGSAGGAPTTQPPGLPGAPGKGPTAGGLGSGPSKQGPGLPGAPGAGFGGGFGMQQPGMPGMGFGGGGMGFAGGTMGGKKEKDLKAMTLDELLAKALKDNPDLRVAESKVREAEAELNRTRLQALQ